MGRSVIAFVVGVVFVCASTTAAAFEVFSQWNLLDFDLQYDYDLVNAFRPENNVPTGLEITYDKVFVATPRLKAGVGATLSFLPRDTPPGSSPPLQAYPDWSWHNGAKGNYSCAELTSVYRMRRDSCNRLWVLDAGVTTSITDFTVVCPPKIVIFDLHTDQAVRVIQFPREVLRPNTLTTNLVLDETTSGGKCDSAFVYISDTTAPGLIVYDGARDSAWRFVHPSMYPDPDFSDMVVDGEKIAFMDGIVGLALAPHAQLLYYQPQATNRIFSVATGTLQKGPIGLTDVLPVNLAGHKSSQGFGLAVDPRNDALIFGPVSETAISAWQPQDNSQTLLAYDPAAIQYATEIRSADLDNNNVWVLTTRFHKYFKETVNPQEVNIRILRIDASHPAAISHGVTNSIYK